MNVVQLFSSIHMNESGSLRALPPNIAEPYAHASLAIDIYGVGETGRGKFINKFLCIH
jgi:hypothetical protein